MFLTEVLHLKKCSLLYHPWDAVLYICTQLLRATHWLFIFACLNYIYPIKIISNLLSFMRFGFIPHLTAKLRKIQEMCHHIYTFFYYFFFLLLDLFLILDGRGEACLGFFAAVVVVWVFYRVEKSGVLWLLLCHSAPHLCLSMEMIKSQRCP